MISPILSTADADTITLDFGVFVAKRAQRYRTSPDAIIAALVPVISSDLGTAQIPNVSGPETVKTPDFGTASDPSPSQPGDTSRSHAPAADTPVLPAGVVTDGVPLAPAVTPLPPLHFSDHPAGGENEVEHETRGPKPLPVASVVPDDARPAEAKTSAEDALSSASGGVQGGLPAHPATPSPETADEAGDEADHVAMNAADHGRVGTGNGAPQHTPGGENEVAPQSSDNSANDAANAGGQRADAVGIGSSVEPGAPPPKRAPSPSERFYIRDGLARYVHQSLEPSPTSEGPMMTANRVYAWFGTKKQFTAAAKRWPELNGMRRIRPQS